MAIRLLYHANKERADLAYREFTIKEPRDGIAEACQGYDVVAFSCYIWNITQTLDAARRIKALSPGTKILLGGPEVSYDWQDIIDRDEVDYIITGEGELPFQAFLENYPDVENVANLVQKTPSGVHFMQKTEQFDLATYTDIMPYADDDPAELRNKVLYIETSRGCPYKCEFCLASLDNKVRYLPDQHIKSTLQHLMQHGRVVKFLDRTFNIKRDFTIEMFRYILAHHRPGNVFQFEITADIVHPDIIRFVNEHVPKGLFRFEIGIQTVNQRANLEVSRKQNFDKTRQIILALQDKVEMHLDLIVGLPLDEWADIRYSFEEVFRLFPPELQLGFLKFLKGTPVRDKHEQHGFVFDSNPPYQIVESNYLSREQLHQIELVEHALEIYWNKKRAVRALRYVTGKYSIFDFLLGLGTHFGQSHAFHQHNLFDIYETVDAYVREQFPDDPYLPQLLALDYYEQHKTRPKVMFLEDLPAFEKDDLVRAGGQAVANARYMAVALTFDVNAFEAENKILERHTQVLFQYNGVAFPLRQVFSEFLVAL